MSEKLFAVKLGAAAVLAALTDFLGWKGVLIIILALMMMLDYVSGTLAAKKAHTWSSTVAREGLFHKGGTILVVLVALVMDVIFAVAFPRIPLIGASVQNPGVFLPLVAVWYVITEIGSIMENAVKMGAPVPKWFRHAIEHAGQLVDKAGEVTAEGSDSNAGKADDEREVSDR